MLCRAWGAALESWQICALHGVHCGALGSPPRPPNAQLLWQEGWSLGSAALECVEVTSDEGKVWLFPPEIPSRSSRCMCSRGLTLCHLLRSSSTKTYICGEENISRKKTLWRVKRQNTLIEQRGFPAREGGQIPIPKTICAGAPGGDSGELRLVLGATRPSLVLLSALALSPNWVEKLCIQLTGKQQYVSVFFASWR